MTRWVTIECASWQWLARRPIMFLLHVEVVAAARARRVMVKRTHKMMVAMLLEKRIQECYVFGEDLDSGFVDSHQLVR